MSKQITTVYVPIDDRDMADVTISEHNANKGFLFAISKGFYLYTPEEHAAVQEALLEEFIKGVRAGLEAPSAAAVLFPNAALSKSIVQGYREALEKMDKPMIDEILARNNVYPESQKQTAVRDGKIGTMYDRIRASMLEFAAAQAALSKTEDKGEGVVHQKRCFTPCAVWAIEAGHCSCYNERPFEQFTLHPESSNPIATDSTTINTQPTNSLDASYTGNSPIPFSPTSGKGMQLSNFHKVVANTPQSVKDEVAADLRKLDNLNALEQIEQWIEHNWPNSHMIIYPKKDLLDKIEELKNQQ
jgi:hypothetical protein